MNRKDRIVYKELNESFAVRSACWQLYKNRKDQIFLCIKFPLYVNLTSYMYS